MKQQHQREKEIDSFGYDKFLSHYSDAKEDDLKSFPSKIQYEQHSFNNTIKDDEKSLSEKESQEKQKSDDDPLNAEKYTKGIVPETDDPTLPALTFRAVFIGTFFNIILSVTGAIFKFRTNRMHVPGIVATIAAYPIGVFMAKVLPSGFFNPGPFSPKEQIIATVIASSGGWHPAGLDNVVIQYYQGLMDNTDVNVWNSLAWIICSQLLGFGLAGLARKFLVRPKAMLWPGVLGTVALVTSFHDLKTEGDNDDEDEASSRYTMSRYKFFWVAAGISFIYAWFPQYIFPALASIPIICLASESKEWKFLGSPASNAGTGLGTITLDWNYLSGSQMISPYWATCNTLLGNAIWWYILVPTIFYTNAFGRDTVIRVKKSPYPHTINSVSLFSSKTNASISALAIMDTTTYDLNVTAYEQHAPLRLASGFVAHYGVSFMALTATVAHVILWHGKDIYKQAKETFMGIDTPVDDVHNRLMKAYTDFSDLTYLIFLAVMVTLNMIICTVTPFQLPWYYMFLALPMSAFLLVPIGTIAAVSGKPVALTILSQFIIGFMNPGKTIWLMTFKTFGLNGIKNAIELLRDLKLGHYMHIDPKTMVYAQIYGTVLAGILNTVVSFLVMDVWFVNVLGTDEWSYSAYKQAYSSAAIFGAIGPGRFFGVGSLYEGLLWFFPIGFVLPFLPWLGNRYWPSKRWQWINIPLLSSMQNPQRKQNYLISTFIVATASQWYAFNYHYGWFKRYNYIGAIGISVGAGAVALLVVILKTNDITMPEWAGTINLESYCVSDPEDALKGTTAFLILQTIVLVIVVITILLMVRRRH